MCDRSLMPNGYFISGILTKSQASLPRMLT